jgi:cell division initiation protein
MKLTPLDIRHKDFKRGMRGYSDVEVDEFLDEVADEYERIFKENIDLGERLEALQDKLAGYKRIEDTLQKTLVSAQASAEELKQNATKQAQLILGDAELKARQLVNDSYTEKQAIEQGMAKLRSAEQDFRFKFRQLLEGYLQQLSEEQPVGPAGEDPFADAGAEAEFLRHAEAIKAAIAREAATAAEALAQVEPAASEEPEALAQVEPAASEEPEAAGEEPMAEDHDVAVAVAAEAEDDEDAPAPERASFGEGDDLMADVDSGVNENEFKW